jgi:hypothetical protein
MHNHLPEDYAVAREWRRTDIAILRKQKIQCVIEIKVMNTYNDRVSSRFDHYSKLLLEDACKAGKTVRGGAPVYVALVAPNPEELVPDGLQGVVKFRAAINRWLPTLRQDPDLVDGATRNVAKCVQDPDLVDGATPNVAECVKPRMETLLTGCLDGGKAFGIPVTVYFRLFRAGWRSNRLTGTAPISPGIATMSSWAKAIRRSLPLRPQFASAQSRA